MQRPMLLRATAFLLLLVVSAACHRQEVKPPTPVSQRWKDFHPVYPSMFRSAGVGGEVAFEVHTDSAGRPLISTFTVQHSTNDLFGSAVKRALTTGRAAPFQIVRDTVIFRTFSSAEDSVQACAHSGGATVVCGRQPPSLRKVVY
jgi:hypothetical protein